MDTQTIALFGEAEKGYYRQAYICDDLSQLIDNLGHPPPESWGLYYAIQALLYHYRLIFFRVREEGFSTEDYLQGVDLLREKSEEVDLSAVFAPGLGNSEILQEFTSLCQNHHSLLITTESDLYDYLTEYSQVG